LTTRPVCRLFLVSCLPSLEEFLLFMPDTFAVAVSGVSGAETCMHTPAPGESEAQNRLPDSILSSKWCCLCWGEMVEVMGSRVMMEMGEKMAEKYVGKKGGKHCAVHSVLNREGDRVVLFGILHF
nr:hypothetical protein [Tanacetum cinerariifolium]